MYRIALIQNESEMMRYSWADIRPMLERLRYPFDGFTAENIEELFRGLPDKYDAIIVASNACNDKIVRESLERHKDDLESFLMRGKGLLVSFQMRMADFESYAFLPESLRISAKNRIYAGEKPQDGELVSGDGHTVLRYPIRVDLNKVKQRCLTNNLVEGIYWIFLVLQHPESYEILIEDRSHTPSRALLIASRADLPFRVVISALALDWQMHDDLWENAVRYVVEGRPSIAVLTKAGSTLFDFRFLVSSLDVRKFAFAEYVMENIDPGKVALDVHDTYILDPSWSQRDVDSFVADCSTLIDSGRARIIYFGTAGQKRPTLQAISNVREYQIIARNAITWLLSKFPEVEDQGYWAGSFWCTVDVLTTLVTFGVPIGQFGEKVVRTIEKHDRNGSYDEVLGATCAMLELYSFLLGKDHSKTRRALEWILARVQSKPLFEQATAYDVLHRLEIEIPQSNLLAFRNEVMGNLHSMTNELMIYRYARTLLTCGFSKDAAQVALRLLGLQDPGEGKWINVPNTAAIVELLIEIQKSSQAVDPRFDEMIFRAIQYLRRTYNPEQFSWNSDVSATAKSLRALRAFEQRISFPIDVALTAVESGYTRARNYIAIEAASALNLRLQNQAAILNNQIEKLKNSVEKQEQQSRFAVRLGAVLTVVVSISCTFALLFSSYLAQKGLLGNGLRHVSAFLSQSILIVIPSISFVLVVALIYVLRRLGKWPRWLDSLLSPIVKFDEKET